jgi:hypothetical protein
VAAHHVGRSRLVSDGWIEHRLALRVDRLASALRAVSRQEIAQIGHADVAVLRYQRSGRQDPFEINAPPSHDAVGPLRRWQPIPLAPKMLRCGSFSNKSRKIMPNKLSRDAELTAQCTATRMFAIYQATALFWALAEKRLIDPQHVFATNDALALGFEQMAANISADDTQGRINQLTAEMLREFEGVIKNVVDNAVEGLAGASVESIRSDRVTASERGAQSSPSAASARLSCV